MCGLTRPVAEFNHSRGKPQTICVECHAIRSAYYYRASKGRYNEVRRAYRARVRATVLADYGGVCGCCGQDEPKFLGIDHINGGGGEDRKRVGPGYAFYLELYRSPRRADLQVLCHNCNFAKGMYGNCPHRPEL